MKATICTLILTCFFVCPPVFGQSAERLTQKDVDGVASNIKKLLSTTSPSEREARANELASLQARLKDLKTSIAQRDANQSDLNATKRTLADAEKSADLKNRVFEKAKDIYNQNRVALKEEGADYDQASRIYNAKNHEFTIPNQQTEYEADRREGQKIDAWKARIEARINEDNRENARLVKMKTQVETIFARIPTLREKLDRFQQRQADVEQQVNQTGWTLVHVLTAFASGKPSGHEVPGSTLQQEELKDTPGNNLPRKSLSQTLADSTALDQLRSADRQGKAALDPTNTKERMAETAKPPFDTKAEGVPGDAASHKSTETAKPKSSAGPETPVSKQEAVVRDYDKKAQELKQKLFDINKHPEKFKTASEQNKAMQAVIIETQILTNERAGALKTLSDLKELESVKPPPETPKPKKIP